jgi:four helix bundle protein
MAGLAMGVPRMRGYHRPMIHVRRQVLFDQDRLDAYNLGRSFARGLGPLLGRAPRGEGDRLDQIRRAALSITLNTAEGAGEYRPKEKARFYRMARRSTTEAAAVLDSLVDAGRLREEDIEPARQLLHRLAGALTRLVQSCDPEWPRTSTRPSPNPPAP